VFLTSPRSVLKFASYLISTLSISESQFRLHPRSAFSGSGWVNWRYIFFETGRLIEIEMAVSIKQIGHELFNANLAAELASSRRQTPV
jgi:hypothetical protein